MSERRRTQARIGKDWTRDCERIEEVVDGERLVYLAMREPPVIRETEDDIEYVCRRGDRLDLLADRYYQDVNLWWIIAQVNGLDLPLVQLNPGRTLVIPNPKYVKERIAR